LLCAFTTACAARRRRAIRRRRCAPRSRSIVTGFDPAATQDLYSGTIELRIFDALYDWGYLERPYALVPSIAAACPNTRPTDAHGRSASSAASLRRRSCVQWQEARADRGRRRLQLEASRRSAHSLAEADLIRGKLVGIDAAPTRRKTTGRFDYDCDIEGFAAIDRY
jgi:hypothetical protein